jgi:pimeloyl-ACP methyl ester carboxylesterase
MLAAILTITVLAALPILLATAVAYAHGRRRGDAGTEPLGWMDAARAFLHEWLAAVALIAAAPFRLRRRSGAAGARGVAILVPERYCSSAGFWYLDRRLRAAGWSSLAGVERHRGDADVVAALDACVARLPAETEIVVIGHGVGGLIARVYAAARPDPRIRHVITLGTPHQGSSALPYRLIGMPAGTTADDAMDVIAIYSDFDAWLAPVDDAYCPRAFNIAVRGIGHCAMLQSRRVADLIAENLAAPMPGR